MDKAAVICELHEITDHYLLGEGNWPADEENLPALFGKFRALGLDEDVPGSPGMTQSTTLGKELKLELVMAFVGAYEIWNIPEILVENGYLTESEADELYFFLAPLQAERKLRRYVYRAYLEYCNRFFPLN